MKTQTRYNVFLAILSMKSALVHNKRAVSRGRDFTYALSFFEDVNRRGVWWGRIEYVFRDGSRSIMSQEDPTTARKSWHRQCRLNRARVAGRPYHHIIENRRALVRLEHS